MFSIYAQSYTRDKEYTAILPSTHIPHHSLTNRDGKYIYVLQMLCVSATCTLYAISEHSILINLVLLFLGRQHRYINFCI